jgi:hypothetical protein
MGTKPNACYDKAMPDEPVFVLLGRDPQFRQRVTDWANERAREIENGNRPPEDWHKVEEALRCAVAGPVWRKANDGAWRKNRGT